MRLKDRAKKGNYFLSKAELESGVFFTGYFSQQKAITGLHCM
jgi:hypothetical protein